MMQADRMDCGIARRGRWRRHTALLLLVTLVGSGCYRNIPLAGEPEPGTRVAATLTVAGRDQMQQLLGPDVIRVEGETAQVRPDQWELRMINTWHAAGTSTSWNREAITFPTSYLGIVEERRLDTFRTALMVGVISGVALVVGRTWVKGWFDGNDGPIIQPPQ